METYNHAVLGLSKDGNSVNYSLSYAEGREEGFFSKNIPSSLERNLDDFFSNHFIRDLDVIFNSESLPKDFILARITEHMGSCGRDLDEEGYHFAKSSRDKKELTRV